MTVAVDLDAPRPARDDAFSDALTLAFADPVSGACGTLRLGVAAGRAASGLVILFHDGRQVALAAEGDVPVSDPSAWDGIAAAGIDVETLEPLRRWHVSFAGEEGSLDLDVEACGPAAAFEAGDPVAELGGMLGFELPVRVRGTGELGGQHVTIDALGQRSRSWGSPDWSRIDRTRLVQAWFDGGCVSVAAIAPLGRSHGDEVLSAAILGPHGVAAVADTRLSTTFDGDGRQQRAALELWPDDDGAPRRLAGEVICGTTLDLGRLRLDCSFVSWRMGGERGVGRYDVLRRIPG